MTHMFGRVGAMAAPSSDTFESDVRSLLPEIDKVVRETELMLIKNRIFLDRMQGIGKLSKERAVALGCTGPILRSTGVPYDVRRDNPYLVYDRFEFEVPV